MEPNEYRQWIKSQSADIRKQASRYEGYNENWFNCWWEKISYDIEVGLPKNKIMKRSPSSYAGYVLRRVFPKAKTILAIGCRNDFEVKCLEAHGFSGRGCEVFPVDSDKMDVVDAHNIVDYYGEKSFDLIYSSHSLEHCADARLVLREIKNISKMGGWIALPYGNSTGGFHPSLLQVMTRKGFNPIMSAKEGKQKLVDNMMIDFDEMWEKYQTKYWKASTNFNPHEFVFCFSFLKKGKVWDDESLGIEKFDDSDKKWLRQPQIINWKKPQPKDK